LNPKKKHSEVMSIKILDKDTKMMHTPTLYEVPRDLKCREEMFNKGVSSKMSCLD